MDRQEYFSNTTGRALYTVFLDAIRLGATVEDLEPIAKEALAKAYRAMDSAGISN